MIHTTLPITSRAVPTKVLVWQWGRHGAMPRFAALLAEGLRALPGMEVVLSLSSGAELLRTATPPRCDLPVDTYDGLMSCMLRLAGAPFTIGALTRRIAMERPEIAICIHQGPLDPLMTTVLRRLRVPFVALVHDADTHPGDGFLFQMPVQRFVCRQAAAIGVLTSHVGEQLLARGLAGTPARPLIHLSHPPVAFQMPSVAKRQDNDLHLLMFGRLLAYKGLDLLAAALKRCEAGQRLKVRVVGTGPDSAALRDLQTLPGVTVENRWVPEDEIGALLAWSDAVVLPYREASQSGVAAAALAAGRWVLATRVGGLPEQLSGSDRVILCEPDEVSLAAGLRALMNGPRDIVVSATKPEVAWRGMAASLMKQIATLGLFPGK